MGLPRKFQPPLATEAPTTGSRDHRGQTAQQNSAKTRGGGGRGAGLLWVQWQVSCGPGQPHYSTRGSLGFCRSFWRGEQGGGSGGRQADYRPQENKLFCFVPHHQKVFYFELTGGFGADDETVENKIGIHASECPSQRPQRVRSASELPTSLLGAGFPPFLGGCGSKRGPRARFGCGGMAISWGFLGHWGDVSWAWV